jgi:2-octaprenyl-6-methoxyphenol hydroxylase
MAVSSPVFDAVVVGAGLSGLAAVLGLRRAGLRVASVGRLERPGPGRTVALIGPSLDLLGSLGLLADVEAEAAPMRTLRIVDDTGSLFAPRPVEFNAYEIGRDALGLNIENAALLGVLARALGDEDRFETEVVGFDFSGDAARLTLGDGRELAARLVVGADGRGSPSRKAAGIDASSRSLGQAALTLRLIHTRPHDDGSTEFHTREGPFTLVPLPPRPDAPHRSSLVWIMYEASAARRKALGDAELAAEIRTQTRAMLGEIRIDGGRGLFPLSIQRVAALTGRRLALIGDAAHGFPPIGAQGLNLGLRDAAEIAAAAASQADPGGEAALQRYAARRRLDIALCTLGVDALNASLLASFPAVDAARGLGLGALGAFRPLRRFAMRSGLSPFLAR